MGCVRKMTRGVLCAAFLTVSLSAWAELVPEPARPADSLVEGIGVATHWGYHNTVYHQKREQLHRLLGELGVRVVRDGIENVRRNEVVHLDELWALYGVKAILVTEPNRTKDATLSEWKRNRARIAAIEGPNEVNGGWAKLKLSYQGKGWPEGPRLFQDDLQAWLRADPELKDIPLIVLSTAYKGAGKQMAPLRSFDYANTHSYAGGQMPTRSLDFRDPYLLLGDGATVPPLVATESGYHTCLWKSNVVASAQQGISHVAHRKYIPRHVAEYFNAGFRWTVIYEFAAGRPKKQEQDDPEAAFGLLMPDGTPKPAYFALKDLIALLSESRWDRDARQWIRPPAVEPVALPFSLEGAPKSVHHALLQRVDGTFQLLVWNEVSSFDLAKRCDIVNPEIPVTLRLGRRAERITVSRLGPDAPPVKTLESVDCAQLSVPDEVIVVEIKLAKPLTPIPGLAAPSGIQVVSSTNSLEFIWRADQTNSYYWARCNQRNLGHWSPENHNGNVHFVFTRLLPGVSYPFEFFAATSDGGVSQPTRIIGTTNRE